MFDKDGVTARVEMLDKDGRRVSWSIPASQPTHL